MTIHRLFYGASQKCLIEINTLRQELRSAIRVKDLTPEQMARVEADIFETFGDFEKPPFPHCAHAGSDFYMLTGLACCSAGFY